MSYFSAATKTKSAVFQLTWKPALRMTGNPKTDVHFDGN